MKLVLNYKSGSKYDDLPELRYNFPRQYLNQLTQSVGDQIIYYRLTGSQEPRGYFATAIVDRIEPDPSKSNHYYAYVSQYMDFDETVDVYDNNYETPYESERPVNLHGEPSPHSFQRSVRNLSGKDFERIINAGFRKQTYEPIIENVRGQHTSLADSVGERVHYATTRIERERMFSERVKTVYDKTCAVTGLRIINGGGHAEVQAAHIRPVNKKGPDSIRNGIALSGTAHWMFDRGLITIENNYRIRVSNKANQDAKRLILPELSVVPESDEFRPHPQFLEYHRENIFKG